MTDYNELLDQLKAEEISALTIQKEDFMEFRESLIAREDFKHFRGAAFHHGKTVYTYTKEKLM